MLEIRALNEGDIYEETFIGPHVCLPCVDGSRRFFWPHSKSCNIGRNFSVLLIESTLLHVLPGFEWEHYAFTLVIMHFTAGGHICWYHALQISLFSCVKRFTNEYKAKLRPNNYYFIMYTLFAQIYHKHILIWPCWIQNSAANFYSSSHNSCMRGLTIQETGEFKFIQLRWLMVCGGMGWYLWYTFYKQTA